MRLLPEPGTVGGRADGVDRIVRLEPRPAETRPNVTVAARAKRQRTLF